MKRLYQNAFRFTMDEYDLCPYCGEEAYWEGYCYECGYSYDDW